jgi:hypothetical protein
MPTAISVGVEVAGVAGDQPTVGGAGGTVWPQPEVQVVADHAGTRISIESTTSVWTVMKLLSSPCGSP